VVGQAIRIENAENLFSFVEPFPEVWQQRVVFLVARCEERADITGLVDVLPAQVDGTA
jgi:hypothetical protein